MFKFKLGRKQPEDNEARRRLQKELFGLNKVRLKLGFFSSHSNCIYIRFAIVVFLHVHQHLLMILN